MTEPNLATIASETHDTAPETKKEESSDNVKDESIPEVQAKDQSYALSSPLRVAPIHESLPEIKMPINKPDEAQVGSAAVNLHPVTLQPFSIDELRANNLDNLLRQFSDPQAAKQEIDSTVKELRRLIDESEKKTKEIEREMDEKEKTREIERKVYARKLGKDI